ncbi:thiol-disulfide oxidoreductase DCC family protein [Chitinophagaceae bacterium LB-8]|uniref:Thiol-disulfide oxidoreductase DCC family protein n=1 Tax=Paraflavisolibacter caeni TaxID=2982496 RepID=A0A9X2XXG0_9BACT|nr:thiol-disulfide oxidoreductase DCC family protein [Paraflavisolibacter caeni]MCU7551111.1 thiol-disulfide oxidoreductase DCC family protein [Paraflavisolibacter caeni]
MKEMHPIILFDGVCNFCNGIVKFVIRQDHKKVFRFAALQSKAGLALAERFELPGSIETFILIEDGKVYQKSTAALRLYNQLSWYWKWTQLFWIVPRFLRDAVYDLFARNRYRWFGKSEECMIPTPDLMSRFI